MKVLYVTSSSFSGSTLLAFLLNTHPEISTVSEMKGWLREEGESFPCSCGNTLEACPFYQYISNALRNAGLPYEFHDFGTDYLLVKNPTINRYLTQNLPLLHITALEHIRDAIVAHSPWFTRYLKQIERSNVAFIRAALDYNGASVFADVSKNPYRLRHLSRISEFNLSPLYLVRDPHGVTLSTMEARGWDADAAVRLWLLDQRNILRILDEFPSTHQIYYEDLCDSVEETLASIHSFVGLAPRPIPQDFKSVEHHVLGNEMRLRNNTEIRKSEKWKAKLTSGDLAVIDRTLRTFADKHPQHALTEIINHYLTN